MSAVACGGQHASGPSSVVVAPSPSPTPYVYTVERWQVGLPMHHCFSPDVDRQVAQWAADEMRSASGVPQTLDGSCNVTWTLGTAAEFAATYEDASGVQAFADRKFEGKAIVSARLVFRNGAAMFSMAVHEGGHALGLGHSTNRNDVMLSPGAPLVQTFSANERAVLAGIYAPSTK